jgi:peroxiredoxin family protein
MAKEKFTIVVFSGDLDKVLAAFILATTAAAMNMDVKMFFTFWGLNVVRKKKLTSGKNLLQKLMNFMNKGGATRLPLSKFNMMGMGPMMMKKMMKDAKVQDIPEMIKTAKNLGVSLIACTTTFGFMGHSKEDFIPEVDRLAGAASFLADSCEARASYFI